MISRYSTPQMSSIWKDAHRFELWLKIETAACVELTTAGVIPAREGAELKAQLEALLAKGGVNPERVAELEATLRHDVIAFTAAVAEKIGTHSRYFHYGLTSSDIVDTGLAMQIQEAGTFLLAEISKLLAILKAKAEKYQRLPCIGRTHGIFAEPTSFGLKFLGWHAEWQRNHQRLKQALDDLKFGKASGAVGVSPHWNPQFEEKILGHLGLHRDPISTQVIPRDRHAAFMNALSVCGSSLERISVELRHLQRSEVAEVLEGFQKGQKGSSAMPHKRNPISAENLTGCARLLRSYAQAASENVALWHERDISHSSVERVIFPDATHLMHYSLKRMNELLENLGVDEEQVARNLAKAGPLVFSGHFLLELVLAGASRENAYAWIQSCALQSLEKGPQSGKFLELVCSHPQILAHLSVDKLKTLGSMDYQLRHVSQIYSEHLGKRSQ